MPSDPGAGTHPRAGSETTPTCPASAVPHGDRMAFWLSCCPHPARGLVCLGFPRPLPASRPATSTPEVPGTPRAVLTAPGCTPRTIGVREGQISWWQLLSQPQRAAAQP